MEAAEELSVEFREPQQDSKVYKDECVYCFNTPEFPGGLYLCLQTFRGLCPKHLPLHKDKTGCSAFLHVVRTRTVQESSAETEAAQEPTKLAIGVQGGFVAEVCESVDEVEDVWTLVLGDGSEVALSDGRIGPELLAACMQLMTCEGAMQQAALESGLGVWDGEAKVETRHAHLEQVAEPPRVPSKGWRCEAADCALADNLWLNLSDGKIFCGRRQFLADGRPGGGNEHAKQHFQQTGHPLAVKLGTITATGADVYSYDEDDSVLDPQLKQRLKHFGIDMDKMFKSEKTTDELQLDMNLKYEWSLIQEEGAALETLYGPGYTGIFNLGSSCYINSVVQMLASLAEVVQRYHDGFTQLIMEKWGEPADSVDIQMAKLVSALISGDYSNVPPPSNMRTEGLVQRPPAEGEADESERKTAQRRNGVRPSVFRALVGQGHVEFQTKRQQDVEEYIRHLFEKLKASAGAPSAVDLFAFTTEERICDVQSGCVQYKKHEETVLSLAVPLDAATNAADVAAYDTKLADMRARNELPPPDQVYLRRRRFSTADSQQVVRARLSLRACLHAFAAEETVDGSPSLSYYHHVGNPFVDYRSPVTKEKGVARKTVRLATAPKYLLIQIRKFTIADDWSPKKLDIELEVPDELDLEFVRGRGVQPGERLLPDDDGGAAPADAADAKKAAAAEAIVDACVAMGFGRVAAGNAARLTNNAGVHAAVDFLASHADDPTLELAPPAQGGGGEEAAPEDVQLLTGMGFTAFQARTALGMCGADANAAAEYLLLNAGAIPPEPLEPEPMETGEAAAAAAATGANDGPAKYRLRGFISHMGTSTACGHYVCHMRKAALSALGRRRRRSLQDGRWVIFNDEKVALSQKPPTALGYVYLYERVSGTA